eukprot:jgi/Tetstr1/452592/TSEL_039628.t1
MALLLHLTGIDEAGWAKGFREAMPHYRVVTRGEEFDPAEIEYIFVWKPAPDAFEGLDNLKAILSLVGIMGLGVLGTDAAQKLKAIGFAVNGWSRSAKSIEGVEGADWWADRC